MRFREFILTEAKILFTLQDLENAYVSNKDYRVAYIYINKNGDIQLGYNTASSPAEHRTSAEITLWPDEKRVGVRPRKATGTKIDSRLQQLLAELKKAKIIDDTWHIDAGSTGLYKSGVTGWEREFTHHPEELNQMNLSKITARTSRLDRSTTDLVFYHGTSEREWEQIQKRGLLPLKYSEPGYESRAKHKYNENNFYLTTTQDKAWGYAKTRAEQISKKYGGKDTYWKSRSACDYSIKPVVLKVRIPDMYKLRADDDMANDIMRNMARKLWDKKSPGEKERLTKELSLKKGFSVKGMEAMIWRETDEAFEMMLKILPEKVWGMWLESLKRHKQVAYKGWIPPQYIEDMKICG